MITTIAEFWEHYSKLHVPAGTPDNVIMDLKTVFYAGVSCTLDIQKSVSKIKDKDFFQRIFASVIKEVDDFQNKMDE